MIADTHCGGRFARASVARSSRLPALRIALHNPFAGRPVAESELTARLIRAARATGHDAVEVAGSAQLRALDADFVLALHQCVRKGSDHPTYGCMWNPPAYCVRADYQSNILTYDGYFSGADSVQWWLTRLLPGQARGRSLGLMLPTANAAPFVENEAVARRAASVVYVGSNWDGERHRQFFCMLDHSGLLSVHGRADRWSFIEKSYRGPLPFDGQSVGSALARAGIALCLHTPIHIGTALPTMRPFEAAMAGAVIIADRHPFIEREFGDSVLYVETRDAVLQVEGVHRHIDWVNRNPTAALDKARRAHAVAGRFSLERLLAGAIAAHEGRMQAPR